jgi:hypothetical protein
VSSTTKVNYWRSVCMTSYGVRMTTEVGAPQSEPWTPTTDTFGARLALVRQRMSWGNVKEAADACGLPAENWRRWERDGIEPRRLTTIAMAIATRTGCDYLWLVHGPNRGARVPTGRYGRARVLRRRTGAVQPTHLGPFGQLRASSHSSRAVRQTRPIIGGSPRPLSAAVL